jgi:hypothetical protein
MGIESAVGWGTKEQKKTTCHRSEKHDWNHYQGGFGELSEATNMDKTKLYIIGNGFDLHHEIRSAYSDFKTFLKQEDNWWFDLVEDYLSTGEDWSNLESALGDIDIDYIVNNNSVFLPSYTDEDWSDSGYHDFQYEIGKIVDSLSTTLRTQFANWVRQIAIPDATSSPNRLSTLDIDGLYLSFNYTSTLKLVYSVPETNILHIHGEAAMPTTELVLGHAWKPSERKSLNDRPGIEDQDFRVTEAYDILDEYFSKTYKQSEKIIQENKVFFSRLQNIQEIVLLGHSLHNVDRDYLDAVVKAINIDAVCWTIACRKPSEEMAEKLATIRSFGAPLHLISTALWNTF